MKHSGNTSADGASSTVCPTPSGASVGKHMGMSVSARKGAHVAHVSGQHRQARAPGGRPNRPSGGKRPGSGSMPMDS